MLDKFKKYIGNEKRKSPRTVEAYIQNLRAFRKYVKRDYLLIGENDLRRYKKHLVFKNLKNSTINQSMFSLKCFYDWLILEGKIAKNPVTRDLFFKTDPPPIIDIPTGAEIDKMVSAVQYGLDQNMLKRQMRRDLRLQKLKNEIVEREKRVFDQASRNAFFKTLRDKLMISALASSGLRISELLKLTTDDIGGDGSIRVRQGKGNKDRYTFMDERSQRIYGEYREILKERGLKRLYMFTYRQAWNIIKGYAKKANSTKSLRPHSFRHYFITTMGARGMSDTDLSKFSGHKNLSTLARYKNYDLKTQGEIYKKYQEEKKGAGDGKK